MKKSLALCAALLIGCSSSTCKNSEPPGPPVAVPDAGPSVEPTVKPKPEPELEEIHWKTPKEVMALGSSNPDLCIMAYFPDALSGDNTIETTTFTDQGLVKLINKTFIAMEFPIVPETSKEVMQEFKITKLPAIIMAPKNDKLVLQIEGNVPAEVLKKAVEDASKEGELFEKCAEARAKVAD